MTEFYFNYNFGNKIALIFLSMYTKMLKVYIIFYGFYTNINSCQLVKKINDCITTIR